MGKFAMQCALYLGPPHRNRAILTVELHHPLFSVKHTLDQRCLRLVSSVDDDAGMSYLVASSQEKGRPKPPLVESRREAAYSLPSGVLAASICASWTEASSSASCMAMARRSASSISSFTLRAVWKAMPVPAGMSRPTIT